jgi:spore germination protein
MNLSISKRSLVRIISFALAALISLSIFCYTSMRRADAAELKLEYQYLKSISDLGTYLENIDSTLLKTMYAGTSATMTPLSSKLWREAGFAKESLSNLPMGSLNLENTYKFLSQVGDYAVSLSESLADGIPITQEQRDNLSTFKSYSNQLLTEVLVLEDSIRTGAISLREINEDLHSDSLETSDSSITEGFAEFEEGFTSYPTLIYDGPFSDHIMEQEPKMLEGAKEISKEEAKQIAANAAGLSVDQLQDDSDEEGKMPSYCFYTDEYNIAVTKAGGWVNYMVHYRQNGEATMSAEECIELANQYLESIGITSMKQTYYEINDNAMTINYAYNQDGVTCYTDLIKVTVAMDNGEITRYDARGYLTNHTKRSGLTASITAQSAQKALSPLLTVEKSSLCIIPSDALEEKFCYEFVCNSEQGDQVLVYVNAKTGKEENILILYIDENGALTI